MRAETILLATSLALASCAAERVQPTFPEYARARQAIREAEREGARADRLAAVHLALARSQLEQARRRLSVGDQDGARWLLLRAEVDAEMAALIVREAGLRDAARRTLDEASVLTGASR